MTIYVDGIIYSLQKSGGITRYTNELIIGLLNQGNKVVLIMYPNPLNYPLSHTNLKIIEGKSLFKGNIKFKKYLDYFLCKHRTKRYLREHGTKNDIFHSTYLTHYKNLKIPQVITVLDTTREKFPDSFDHYSNKIFSHLTKGAIKRADAIICISRQAADDLSKYYKLDKKKINIIYLGVNSSFKTRTQEEKDVFRISKGLSKPYLLYTGTRARYKNFERFAEAFAKWKNKNDFLLVVVGGGKFTTEELNFFDRLGIRSNIMNFDFATTEEELTMFYGSACAFVFPSLSEGFGLPLLEAMASGIPILASDIPVFREIAQDIPLYFDPYNRESIIDALNRSLKDNRQKIEAGIRLVKKFTWENTINETIKVYNKLLYK